MKHGFEGGTTRRALLGLLPPVCLLAQTQKPYVDKSRTPLEFPAGSDEADPPDVQDVPLGLFGPDDAAHAQGGTLWMGALLAVEDANRAGGYRGKPFRLVSRWSDDPWRGGASAVVKLIYSDQVWAVIGGIDGATTHLAEQVVAKALVPLVDPVSTDQTVNSAGVPWMFSRAPGDPAIAAALVRAIGQPQLTLLAGTDHDSRNLATEFVKAAAARPGLIARRLDVAHADFDPSLLSGEATLVLAPPAQTAQLIARLPEGRPVYAGPAARARLCRGCRAVAPRLHTGNASLEARLKARFGQPADDFSFLSYDAVKALAAAICSAGLNRAHIRDRLALEFGPRGRQSQEVLI